MTCASASDCWAVGYSSGVTDPTPGQTFTEHWNGNAWSIVSSPNPNSASLLSGVTCVSASECWSVGTAHNGTANQTLIERWDGASWMIVPSPNTSTAQANSLNAVTCTSGSACWAVGSANGQTLIEKYSPTIPPLIAVASRKFHGGNFFDVDLPNVAPGVECRQPGATGTPGVDYKIIFTFANSVASCGTTSSGTLSGGPDSNQCTVNLTAVPNQKYSTVTLDNVLDTQNNSGTVATTMGLLIGDVSGDGTVNSGDALVTRNRSGQSTDRSNFRSDVNADGSVNSGDAFLVRSRSGNGFLP